MTKKEFDTWLRIVKIWFPEPIYLSKLTKSIKKYKKTDPEYNWILEEIKKRNNKNG